MMNAFTASISEVAQRELADVVQRLSKHYGFNYLDAMRMIGDDAPSKVLSPENQPGAEKVTEPVPEPEPVSEKVTEPVPEPEPVAEQVTEPVPEPAPEAKKEPASKKKAKAKKSKPAHIKSAFPLPWTGKVVEDWCDGLRPNSGMLSQCCQAPKSDGLCSTCFKQKQTTGRVKCGTVQDRLAADAEGVVYKNPETGKVPVTFAKAIMGNKKNEITKEMAIEEAAKFGLVIPESEFEVAEKRKGRPPAEKPLTKGEELLNEMIKKAVAAVSSSSEDEQGPSTNQESGIVDMTTTDFSDPKGPITPPPAPIVEVIDDGELKSENIYEAETEDEDDEVINVSKFEHDGCVYLRDVHTNMMYDMESQDLVGMWDPTSETVVQAPSELVEDGN
jgi:hypothetical protein